MPDYRKMYLTLFNSVTDALRVLEKSPTAHPYVDHAAYLLRKGQLECEEIFISEDEPLKYLGEEPEE